MSNNLNISTTITTTTAGVGGGGEEEEIIVEPRVVRKPMHLKRIQIDTNSQKNESLSTVTPEAYNNNNNNNSAANQDTSSVSGASNVNNNKQLTYTITRTYIAPNGKTKTKTIEYFGDEAKKLINEMKDRELTENSNTDTKIISNIEDQFDHIQNPDDWLENGFDGIKNTKQQQQQNSIYSYKQKQLDEKYIQTNDNVDYQPEYIERAQRYLQQQQQQKQYQPTIQMKIVNNNNQRIKQRGCVPSKNQQTLATSKFLFIKDALDQHNRYRYVHHVPYLKLNRDLCNLAQQWAEHIAQSGKFEHSNHKYLNNSLGENIAMRFTSTGDELTGKQVTDQWYEEASDYDYNLDFQSGKGHFAQIVWKNSREVGFGRAQSKDGKWYAVANYYPAGNYIGHFRENVFPQMSSN